MQRDQFVVIVRVAEGVLHVRVEKGAVRVRVDPDKAVHVRVDLTCVVVPQVWSSSA